MHPTWEAQALLTIAGQERPPRRFVTGADAIAEQIPDPRQVRPPP